MKPWINMNQLVAAIMTIGLHFRGMFQQGLVFQMFVIPASNASQEGRPWSPAQG
jgi:hypothetical protein